MATAATNDHVVLTMTRPIRSRFGDEKALRPGQTALFQGTGGVSVFGAQVRC